MGISNVTSTVVVLHTNNYAGNFEREMTAYITGQIGDCEVGQHAAYIAEHELDEEHLAFFGDCIVHESDDHGCARPCSIWNAEGNSGYKDVAIFFENVPPQDILEMMLKRARNFSKDVDVSKIEVYNPDKVVKRQIQYVKVFEAE